MDNDLSHNRLAHLLLLRYTLPSLAHLVQLDVLHTHNELPGHVCMQQRI